MVFSFARYTSAVTMVAVTSLFVVACACAAARAWPITDLQCTRIQEGEYSYPLMYSSVETPPTLQSARVTGTDVLGPGCHL